MYEIDSLPQPEWNDSQSVHAALRSVACAESRKGSQRAYDQLLYAIGNNHAGTYYPVALAVVPELGLVLTSSSTWAQHAALNVLIELSGSFEPEAGFAIHGGVAVAESLRQSAQALRAEVEQIAKSGTVASSSAEELLQVLQGKA